MKKRLFPALLALVLALTMLSVGVFASSDPSGSPTEVDDLSALNTALQGTATTIKLTADITATTAIKVEKAVTINFNGHTVSGKIGSGGYIFEVGKKDGTGDSYTEMTVAFQNAKITNTETTNGRCLEVKPGVTMNITGESAVSGSGNTIVNAGKLNITGGTYTCTDQTDSRNVILTGSDLYKTQSAAAVTTLTGATLTNNAGIGASALWGATINVEAGTKITAHGNALGGNNTTAPQYLNVHGGELKSTNDAAIYQAATGKLTITDGTITGLAGVVARAGTVDVTGGTITATGTGNVKVGDKNTEVPASGILYDLDTKYTGSNETTSKITVSGTAAVKAAEGQEAVTLVAPSGDTTTAASKLEVTGGTFDKPVDPKYLDNSLKVQAKSADGNYTYHVSEEAAKQAAGNDAVLGNITNDGKVEPIIKIKATGFIWDMKDEAAKKLATDAGVQDMKTWVDQTIWVAFDQALPTGTHYWFDVEINGTTYGIAANGDGTHAAQAFSFLNLGQWEIAPSDLADAGTGLKDGVTVSAVTVTVNKTETDLSNAQPTEEQRAKFVAVDTPKTVTVPAKPTNANPNLKITSVTTDAPLYAKVTISGMDKSKVYAIRLANSTGKDASMVILIVDNTETYDIYCKDQQKIWVFEYASKDVIVEGDSQHTSLEYGVASKMTTPTAP